MTDDDSTTRRTSASTRAGTASASASASGLGNRERTRQQRGDDEPDLHGGRVRISRSRGAVTGTLLLLLGVWAALIPFVGPYVHFGYTPDSTWHLSSGRFWLQLLPGIAVTLGGLLLLIAANRLITSVGAWLAAAGGAWLLVGPTLSPLLHLGSIGAPIPKNSTIGPVLETLLLFTGLGTVIVFVAAVAIGRLGVVGVRDVRTAQQREADDRSN